MSALALDALRASRPAFVVVPEGDVFWLMQVCPDALLHPGGECRQALWCDCEHSSGGPLWLSRGWCRSRAEADARVAVLSDRFWRDAEAYRSRWARKREAAALPAGGRRDWGEDVPY